MGCGDLPTTRIEQRLLLRLEADRNVLPLRRVADVKINCVVFFLSTRSDHGSGCVSSTGLLAGGITVLCS